MKYSRAWNKSRYYQVSIKRASSLNNSHYCYASLIDRDLRVSNYWISFLKLDSKFIQGSWFCFLSNFQRTIFIPCPTSILDSKVGIFFLSTSYLALIKYRSNKFCIFLYSSDKNEQKTAIMVAICNYLGVVHSTTCCKQSYISQVL